MPNIHELAALFRDAKSRYESHKADLEGGDYDAEIAVSNARAAKTTRPFLMGEHDHLRLTNRPEFDRIRLIAADDSHKRCCALAAKVTATVVADSLRVLYQSVAVALAESYVEHFDPVE